MSVVDAEMTLERLQGERPMVAKHFAIHGNVQGVFYRAWAVDTASGLGLAGWVRNRRDGTVEAVVQGEESAVERFIELARRGPPTAQVQRIDAETVDAAVLNGFAQRPTC